MSGLEIRAEIDAENVRGLLLINGGAAVALLAFLPSILGKPEYVQLTKAILWGLLLFLGGLLSAVTHNHLRRRCSLKYEQAQANSPSHPDPCMVGKVSLGEPCVCIASTVFMCISAIMFVIAGALVFKGGMAVVDIALPQKAEQQIIQPVPVSVVVQACNEGATTQQDAASPMKSQAPASGAEAKPTSGALPPNNSLQARRP
jgi:hypothetical protein